MKQTQLLAGLTGLMLVSIIILNTPIIHANPDGLLADAGGPYTATEGQTITFLGTGGDLRSQEQYRWDFNNDGIYDTPWTDCAFNENTGLWDANATHAYTTVYNGVAVLEVTDELGDYSFDTAQVTVTNAPPTIDTITASLEADVGSDEPITIAFTDDNSTHTITVTWGDGTSTTQTLPSGTDTVTETHIYSNPGSYTVTVTVTDGDGGSSSGTLPGPVVVTVPNIVPGTGFVTGGGWINIPAGSYRPDTTITGTMNFGFNAKYKKGRSTPDGQTEVNFQEANLNFHCTSYDWLSVVNNVATIQGSGTINGAGNYGFTLKSIDNGKLDTFRFRVWDKTTGTLIFDNNADTLLAGGQIQVHRA